MINGLHVSNLLIENYIQCKQLIEAVDKWIASN